MTGKIRKQSVSSFDRMLALGAVAGPIIFTIAWVILQQLSPGYTLFGTHIAPYKPISQPVSGLGLGVTGPYMNTAFVLSGLLLLLGAFGISRSLRGVVSPRAQRAIAVILAIPALGCIGDGLFTLESFFVHFLGFGLVLTTIIGFPIIGWLIRRSPLWHMLGIGLILSGPLTLALAIWYFSSFTPTAEGALTGIAGLIERILIIEILAWYVGLGWQASRRRV